MVKLQQNHVGKLIEERLKVMGISQAEFAKKMNQSQQNVSRILKKKSMDTEKLIELSILLEHNFFEDFCPNIKKEVKEEPNGYSGTAENVYKELYEKMLAERDEYMLRLSKYEDIQKSA